MWGCENIVLRVVEVSKRGVRKKCAFFVFAFFMLDKAKEKNGKDNFKNNQKKKKTVFWGDCEEKRSFLLKWHF